MTRRRLLMALRALVPLGLPASVAAWLLRPLAAEGDALGDALPATILPDAPTAPIEEVAAPVEEVAPDAADMPASEPDPEPAPEPEPEPAPAPSLDNISAVRRAEAMMRATPGGYVGQCERFAELAIYGRDRLWANPVVAARAGNVRWSHWREAPLGAHLLFAGNRTNGFLGHAGVKSGPDEMISATYVGIHRTSISSWSAAIAPFVGWRI